MSTRRARRAQALEEIRRLESELEQWVNSWQQRDRHEDGSPRGQYRSQLQAISSEVTGTAAILARGLEAIDVNLSVGDVYAACANVERQTVWLWRVWYFFREKFDQRLDPRFARTLRAADEVVWSCYRPYFKKRGGKPQPGGPPLPYIEADYSPSALRRFERNALKRRGREHDLVANAFQSLPIPLLKIPITTLRNPWAMVLIGHEAGHYVQPEIQSEFRYQTAFGEAIRDAVARAPQSEADDPPAWQRWGEEIFADWYSVLTMGQWGVWAMAQFEIAEKEWMLTRRIAYPSPLVRLALMAALADRYGLAGTGALRDLGIRPADLSKGHEEATRDLSFIPGVVAAITSDLPENQGKLENLVGFRADRYELGANGGPIGEVAQWARYISRGGAKPSGATNLHAGRTVAAGMAQAWSTVVFDAATPQQDEIERLRTSGIDAMIQAAEPGVRSVGVAPTRSEPGRALADLLVHADDDQYFEPTD